MTTETHPNASAFPNGLSGPALRALHKAGITSMTVLARWSERDVAKLHGVGPRALRVLKQALTAHGRHFHAEPGRIV